VERSVCLTLARLLSAARFLHAATSEVARLVPRRVLMTSVEGGEFFPVLRPSSRAASGLADSFAADVSELVVIMLRTDCGVELQRRRSETSSRREKPGDPAAGISPRSSYTRCLQRVVRCVHQNPGSSWTEGLTESLRLLEFTLWGPSEDEARMMAVSDGRESALQVWVSISRCRMLADLAVAEGTSHGGLELAEQAAFLSSATESSLLDATKMLFT